MKESYFMMSLNHPLSDALSASFDAPKVEKIRLDYEAHDTPDCIAYFRCFDENEFITDQSIFGAEKATVQALASAYGQSIIPSRDAHAHEPILSFDRHGPHWLVTIWFEIRDSDTHDEPLAPRILEAA